MALFSFARKVGRKSRAITPARNRVDGGRPPGPITAWSGLAQGANGPSRGALFRVRERGFSLPFLLHAKEHAMNFLRLTGAALAAATVIGAASAAMADHRYHHYGYYYSPYYGPGPYYYNPYYYGPGLNFRLDIR
jgi:hypothetical protein